MWDVIKKFFIDNQSSIIVSLIIGAIFFILGPLGLWFSGKKVRKEKINKAKAEFLDLIESMLVNKESISRSKLLTLFSAIERQNGINLELDSDIENLLEDLALRFARSKHLSPEQKDEYSDQIDKLISSINEPKNKTDAASSNLIRERELPKSLKSILTELRANAEQGDNKEELIEKIEQLEKYYRRPADPISITMRLVREKPKLFLAVLIVYIIIIILITRFIDK